MDIYEAHLKCLDDNEKKKELWLNISTSMHEMGYVVSSEFLFNEKKNAYRINNAQRSSNDCCEKWKNLCRTIQFGGPQNHYNAERVKYLLNEVVYNLYINDTKDKKVTPSVWSQQLQNEDCFEIMV